MIHNPKDADGLECICPECKQELVTGEHLPGCSYILSPEAEAFLEGLVDALIEAGVEDLDD